ncbi:MAG TPA: DUF1573 domain-containing protein [Bacteroidales bacterium]|nr:DUF1573 domain-containing protein [Bacteroidales bacterium]
MIRTGQILFVIFAFSFLMSCRGKTSTGNALASSSDTAVIEFEEYEHDFGKIIAGEKVATIFKFKNTGKGPLVLNSVTTSCGCTVSKYSTKPILPGDSGTIEVIFDSGGYNGMQKKTVTVRSNASNPYVMLQIKAEVITGKNN